MKKPPSESSDRPERVLLHLAQSDGEVRGKAVRFRDQSTFRFRSLAELVDWLRGWGASGSSSEQGSD